MKLKQDVKAEDAYTDVQFEGDDDSYNPLTFSKAKKWTVVFVIAQGSFCVTCCSSLVTVTYDAIMERFNASRLVVTLGLTLFVAGLGLSPLFFSPLSEFFGRRWIYIISFLFFIAFNVQTAVSQNIETLLIARFLAGFSGSAFLSVSGGSVSDIYKPTEVGNPMVFVSLAPFLGPVFGPIIGDLMIGQGVNWRWVWYLQIIWSAAVLAAIYFFVPETYAPRLLQKKAHMLRRKTGDSSYSSALDRDTRSIASVVLRSCYIPFQLLATEAMALLLCIWTALLLGIIYAFFSAFPIVFRAHGFSTTTLGLSFLGIGLGEILAVCTQPIWNKRYKRLVAELGGKRPPPEAHLVKGMVGAIIGPLSLIWFAFTTYPSVHWSVPIIATIPFGMAVVFIFAATFTYLVDAFRPVAASAMAANSFMRSAFAAGFPLFTVQMYESLGSQWASFLVACLLGLLSPLPFVLYYKGAQFRGKGSRFAQKPD